MQLDTVLYRKDTIGSIIELTQPVVNKASAYDKYFKGTNNIMPVGTLFRIIKYADGNYNKNQLYGVRLLIDGVEIVQNRGSQGCYHSLEVEDYQLCKPSKLRKLLDHVRMVDDI